MKILIITNPTQEVLDFLAAADTGAKPEFMLGDHVHWEGEKYIFDGAVIGKNTSRNPEDWVLRIQRFDNNAVVRLTVSDLLIGHLHRI